jgi:hypothetical protein
VLPCPECGFKNESELECQRCGLVFQKWRIKPETKRFDYSISGTLALLVVLPTLVLYGRDLYEWLLVPPIHFIAVDSKIVAAEDEAPGEDFEDWYPEDLSAPEGLRYPCALTPLPKALTDIPPSNRRFVNHAFALILRSARARLKVQAALADDDPAEQALADYSAVMGEIMGKLKAEPTPRSLESVRGDLITAFDLQAGFFPQAFAQRRAGVPVKTIMANPERKVANRKLLTARARLKGRYPKWGDFLRDSVYHHLCNASL